MLAFRALNSRTEAGEITLISFIRLSENQSVKKAGITRITNYKINIFMKKRRIIVIHVIPLRLLEAKKAVGLLVQRLPPKPNDKLLFKGKRRLCACQRQSLSARE